MNRNFRPSKVNTSKRGKAKNGVPFNFRGSNSSASLFNEPMHRTGHGHLQQLDKNPFSHLASEIEMDRPSANPFDKGVMPSFDDRAIDEDYRNQVSKKFGGLGPIGHSDRQLRSKKQSTKELVSLPLALDVSVPTFRRVKEMASTTTPMPAPVREPAIGKNFLDGNEELDLDDFLPRPPIIKPSVDLKPQINIRSQNFTAAEIDAKPRFNIYNRKAVADPVIAKPVQHTAPEKSVPPKAPKPKTELQLTPTKQVVDYFGAPAVKQQNEDTDEKQEYFRESQLEANKILFGVEELSRPLTNSEISKRKKLILKLVDQKLKKKLTQLMNQLGERSKAGSVNPSEENTDNFADHLENLVPDSIPDNANPELTQNWTSYPSEAKEQIWGNVSEKNFQDTWEIRPPPYQMNSGWMEPQMNPYPPGVDPIHNVRFPRMPSMRPEWNQHQWHPNPHMRPQQPYWQPRHDWNMPVGSMNPHLMQPNIHLPYPSDEQHSKLNIGPFPVPSEKPLSEAELALKEKEFLERTLMGSKTKSQHRDFDSKRHRSPEKVRRRSPRRSRQFESDRKKRGTHDRSPERNVHRGGGPPAQLSSGIPSPQSSLRHRSQSAEPYQELVFDEIGGSFEPAADLEPRYRTRSRSKDSRSEDLRIKLSERRNKNRSRSPADLRNKLSDNRQNRNDDLRTQLAQRSRHKRSRSSSRDRSNKKLTKSDSDVDSEWIKFNNIVGMLMNIGRDTDLTSEEMAEKKEIMKLLLENPDLLELDEKFVYKFGKGRLTLAVKEAENILYPKGVPDERIASLISKKIAALSTVTKVNVEKDTVPIEWIKLGNIIDQVLHLTIAEQKKLSANDKRLIERDELLLKVSDDPKALLPLGTKYGHRNVEWASKYAMKILFYNGVRDRRVDEIIAKERSKALERIRKIKQLRRSSESHNSRTSGESDAKSISSKWNEICAQVTKLVQSTLEKFEKMSREDIRRRDDLLVQMSRDPDAIRSNTKFTDNVDNAILNDVIGKCKEIIASVKSSNDKAVVSEFERQRSRLINTTNSRTPRSTIYDQILLRISPIFGKKQEKWTAEEKKEREILTTVLIRDPEALKTDVKALERIGDDKLVVDEIIADVKQILFQLDPSKARGPKKFHISSTKVLDIPFVVKIEDTSDQLNNTTKTILLKALRDMITEIENPPKPKLLQQRYIDKRVEVVCANLLTFEWLKRAIVSDFKDKWSGAELKIERIPVEKKIPRDELKSVVAVFKDTRATLPFDDIVREFRKENPKLYPERWELQDGRGKDGDYKKKTIGIDIESLAALEQMNRFARLGRSLVYFDISYMGDGIPNFEATCQ